MAIARLGILAALCTVMLSVTSSQRKNIALHRPYTLTPAPNYTLSTDPEDAAQLTDAGYSESGFWPHKSTVGWTHVSPVSIVVDLGHDAPIAGASFDTAAGRAGVQFPAAIWVLVSVDGKQWHEVGDLVTASKERTGPPPAQGYASHCFRTDQWRTHGRWVAFLVVAEGEFCFTDEIQVYEGEPAWLSSPLPGPPMSDFTKFLTQKGVLRRFHSDWQQLRELVTRASIPSAIATKLGKQLDELKQQTPTSFPVGNAESFRAVLPFKGWHERLFSIQARLWQACGVRPLAIWVPPSPYDPLPYLTDKPIPTGSAQSAALALMRGETRPVAVNIANSRDRPVTILAQLKDLPDGPTPAYVHAASTVWTDTRDGRPVATALPEAARQDNSYRLIIPSGVTGQLWLNIHPTRQIPAGEHRARIVLVSDAGDRAELPLKLYLAPLDFPQHQSLHLGGWDYTDTDRHYSITPENGAAVIAELQEYLVDLPWATASVMPPGRFNREGQLVGTPDCKLFDRWLSRWTGASRYYVFLQVSNEFQGVKVGTPEFNQRTSQWVRFWSDHMREKGLTAGQVGLLLVDEPRTKEQDQLIVQWATVIKQAAPAVALWEDPDWPDPGQMDERLSQLCDVLCPKRASWLENPAGFSSVYLKRRTTDPRLGIYGVGIASHQLDPYAFYRMHAWQCFAAGAVEEHFWSFTDSGGASSWNPYLAHSAHTTPLFLAPDSVIPAKQMEAIREGIEDYETLAMLQEAVKKAGGSQDSEVAEAKRLLSEGVETVQNPINPGSMSWYTVKDRTLADRARERALRLLVRLAATGTAAARPLEAQ